MISTEPLRRDELEDRGWLPSTRVPMESALIGCLFAAMPTGIFYGFSLYSAALQKQLGLTDGQKLNIATLPYIFGATAPFIGGTVQRVGQNFGILGGCSLVVAGMVLQYAIANKQISLGPPAVSLVVLSCLVYIGVLMITGVAFSLPVKFYQRRRGQAMAIVKCFVGLSGAAVAQLFYLMIGSRPGFDKTDPAATGGLLLWAVVSAVSCIIAVLLLPRRRQTGTEFENHPRMQLIWWLLLAWGICTILVSLTPEGAGGLHRFLAVVLIVLLSVPLLVLLYWSRQGPLHDPTYDPATASREGNYESPSKYTFCEMIQKPESWFFLWCCVSIIGGGATLSANMSDILTAGGNGSNSANVLANTLFSAGNMLGRLTCMVPSDALVRKGCPRPLILVGNVIGMAGAHGLFFLLPYTDGSEAIIACGALLGGCSFGTIWPHMAILASELFGSKHLQMNYLFFDGGGGCLGNLLMARALTGAVLNAHSTGDECIGAGCFGLVHATIFCMNLVGIMFALLMVQRSRPIYELIHKALTAPNRDEEKL